NTIYSQEVFVNDEVRSALRNSGNIMVLVKLKENTLTKTSQEHDQLQIERLQDSVLSGLTEADFQLRYRYKSVPGFSGILFASGLAKLTNHPQVESIAVDMSGQGGLAQSVPAVQADVVQNLGFTGKGVVVGVLDSGVNASHPDLNLAIVHQYHFLNQGTDVGPGANDQHSHGSNVAGIITSDGLIAPEGVAPDASIVAIRVLDRNNRGWVSDWIAGMDYIVANNAQLKVQIINMSLVTDAQYPGSNCDLSQSLFATIVNAAKNLGIIIFASSGNTGSTTSMTAPACLSAVTAVGAVYDSNLGREPNSGTYQSLFGGSWPDCADATTSTQILTCFTSRNTGLDLVAPGARITSVGLGQGTTTFRGTSQASPHAAGVAALMLEKDPSLTRTVIINILKSSATQVNDPQTGFNFPLLNALDAIGKVTEVSASSNKLPQSFILAQNFPNPLRSSGTAGNQTVIRYILSSPETVSLTFYDILGREVKRLVKGFQVAGEHQVTFRGQDLPNGVYFYQLTVGSFSKIRKLVVLR
ncbi:MAG: S8 family serine peptidase, partial [bacterium]